MDPDIILVGEIRDKETAQIAVEAALTGHLLVSTLHTNDAPSTVSRIGEMGSSLLIFPPPSSVSAPASAPPRLQELQIPYDPKGASRRSCKRRSLERPNLQG